MAIDVIQLLLTYAPETWPVVLSLATFSAGLWIGHRKFDTLLAMHTLMNTQMATMSSEHQDCQAQLFSLREEILDLKVQMYTLRRRLDGNSPEEDGAEGRG